MSDKFGGHTVNKFGIPVATSRMLGAERRQRENKSTEQDGGSV